MDLGTVTAQTFTPHQGTEFRVTTPGTPEAVLRLAAVDEPGPQPQAPRPDPFALVFIGPGDPRLVQRIHRLEHEVLGTLELFLVPIGPDDGGGLRYEAVFN